MPQTQTSLKHAAIQYYLDRRFVLFPLRLRGDTKKPAEGCMWRDLPFNAAPVLPGNYGVQLRPDTLVIDVDPRNGGELSFLALCAKINIPADTFSVTTGSGGTHYYLTKPLHYRLHKNLKEYPGLDFLTDGHYVVGAGSVHPDTKLDYAATDLTADFKPAPQELLELLGRAETTPSAPGKELISDDEQTRSRFINYLKGTAPAVQGAAGDNTTFAVAAVGHDYGLSEAACLEALAKYYNPRCKPPWSTDELQRKVANVYRYARDAAGSLNPSLAGFPDIIDLQDADTKKLFHRTNNGSIKNDQHNTALFFSPVHKMPLAGVLGYNEFSNNIEFLKAAPWHNKFDHPGPWTDGEALRAKHWLSTMYKFEPATQIMHEAAYVAAAAYKFHPVKQYLNKLEWDQTYRVHKWLSEYMGAEDNAFTRTVGLKFLVAAVKRIFEPGCKFDYILTLEGKQGIYKSTSFEILATRKDWYCDPTMDITSKDSVFALFGKWIVEMPEMATHYKAETKAMASFLSRSTDRARLPYASTVLDFPRQCVFGGTINPESDPDIGWLKNTTGNRRYWPVLVGVHKQPDMKALSAVVNQLWAEALLLYKEQTQVFIEDRAIADMAQIEQEKRMGTDPWHDVVASWVDLPQTMDIEVLSGEEIFQNCLNGNLHQYTYREMGRISRIMMRLGWTKGVYWAAQTRTRKRGYKRPVVE